MKTKNDFRGKTSMPKFVSLNEQSISPTAISRIIIGIILLIILIQFGFFKTYLRHFPKFEEFTAGPFSNKYTTVMHFHGVMMMGWVWMLLLQPILVLKGKIQLHRLIGSLSYVLAPLVLLSMYLVNREAYNNLLARDGQTTAVAIMALIFPAAVFFAILYSLAIFYRHSPALHMRFMCSTAFLLVVPASDRMFATYFGVQSPFELSSLILISVVGIIAVVDSLRTNRISAFTLIFGFVLLHRILWELKYTAFWQTIGGAIAKIFG